MEEKKCFIPVVCQGCEDTGKLKMDNLFDGKADTVGKTYQLSKPITDYQVLIVEFGVFVSGEFKKGGSVVIAKPKPSNIVLEYLGIRAVDFVRQIVNGIAWHFPTENTIIVDDFWKSPNVEFIKISKIYGIK